MCVYLNVTLTHCTWKVRTFKFKYHRVRTCVWILAHKGADRDPAPWEHSKLEPPPPSDPWTKICHPWLLKCTRIRRGAQVSPQSRLAECWMPPADKVSGAPTSREVGRDLNRIERVNSEWPSLVTSSLSNTTFSPTAPNLLTRRRPWWTLVWFPLLLFSFTGREGVSEYPGGGRVRVGEGGRRVEAGA